MHSQSVLCIIYRKTSNRERHWEFIVSQACKVQIFWEGHKISKPISKFFWCQAVVPGCAGCAMAHPDFGRSLNPVSTRGTDYAHLITTLTPDFQTFRRPWRWGVSLMFTQAFSNTAKPSLKIGSVKKVFLFWYWQF